MSCKTINIDLANVPPVPLQIGVAGENAFRTITFDASTWGADFPDATYTVVYKRSDGYMYPVLVNASADTIVWSPTDIDTAVSGNGQIEVRLLDGETIGKTIIMQTYVAPSLSGDESEPSEPAPDWVNDVTADADRAEAAVEHYPKIVNGVWYVWDVQSEDFISTGIEAQGDPGVSPTVTVTTITGGHRVTITDATGDHTFDVMDGDDSSGGGDDVFIAVRGTTTEAEIREAHGAGKVVICVYQNRVYYLSDDGTVTLRTNPNEQGMVYELVVVGSRWTGINYNLALASAIPAVPITGVSVNGIGLTPQDGVVDVPVPTDYVTSAAFDDRTEQMLITLSLTNGIIALEQSDTPLSVLIRVFMNNCNAWFVLPTAYITGIQSNTDMMRFWMTGANIDKSAPTVSLTSVYGGKVYHAVLSPVSAYRMEGQLQVLDYQTAAQVQTAISGVRQLPTVTASDNGKFLRVVNGAWAVQTVPSAESNSFGGA